MDKDDILQLAEGLSGDEHSWVDLKEDYDIGGIEKCRAEFAKDVSSLANAPVEREKRFILVGFDDDGNLVGINQSRMEYRGQGPRHIFSFDESDFQQSLDSLLDPIPDVSWHTFQEDGENFGALIISPPNNPPSVIEKDLYDGSNNQLLHKGRIYIRKGSSKAIALNPDINKIVDRRVQQRRDEILDGIHRAVEVGPEAISRFGGMIKSEDDEGVPITIEDDAEYAFQERVSREPSSNLDSLLNGDIVRWKDRQDDFIEAKPLWEYYARFDELTLDEEALYFLTQSSIKNELMGFFWLEKADDPVNVLLETEDNHHRTVEAAKALTLLGDEENLNKLIKDSSSPPVAKLGECQNKVSNNLNNRVNFLLQSTEHDLHHDNWKQSIEPKNLDINSAKAEIPSLCSQLIDIQNLMKDNYGISRGRRDEFRDALYDLEVVIGKDMVENR